MMEFRLPNDEMAPTIAHPLFAAVPLPVSCHGQLAHESEVHSNPGEFVDR